jgi:hypothetical protein
MRRKKPKKHPKQSRAERKEILPTSNLRIAVNRALSSGWVQNSGVGFLFTGVALIAAIMNSTQVKVAAVTFALAGTLASWIIAVVVIRHSNEPQGVSFSLLFKSFEGSHKPNVGAFWCRYWSGYGDTVSPASAVLYLTVKNLNTSPLFIERLEVSVQKKGQPWVLLRNIPPEGCRLYWIYGDPKQAALLDMNALEPRIHSSIPAGETIPGWMFLAVTKEYLVRDGDLIRWRIRTKDSAGEKSEYISDFETLNGPPNFDTSAVQPVPIKPTGLREDLSKLYFRNYEPMQ